MLWQWLHPTPKVMKIFHVVDTNLASYQDSIYPYPAVDDPQPSNHAQYIERVHVGLSGKTCCMLK